jgi:hypothetical protein
MDTAFLHSGTSVLVFWTIHLVSTHAQVQFFIWDTECKAFRNRMAAGICQ